MLPDKRRSRHNVKWAFLSRRERSQGYFKGIFIRARKEGNRDVEKTKWKPCGDFLAKKTFCESSSMNPSEITQTSISRILDKCLLDGRGIVVHEERAVY